MMDGYVQSLLRSHEHSRALLKTGSEYGIKLVQKASSTSNLKLATPNVINLGVIPYEDLERCIAAVPIGYENAEDEFNRISESVSIRFEKSDKFTGTATATLTGIQQFPRNGPLIPKLIVESIDTGEALSNFSLSMNGEAACNITFEMDLKFSGFLKRLLILNFDVTEEVDFLVKRKTSITMGVMILGNVTPRGLDRALHMGPTNSNTTNVTGLTSLSIDAQSFSPIANITKFDTMCRVISLATCPKPLLDAFSPPPHYCKVLTDRMLLAGAGFADRLAQELQYVRHLRANTLQCVIDKLELCTVGDLVEKHSLSAALSYQYCQDLLSNHIKLINLEEIQTKIDIAQYDLHYVQLVATMKDRGSALPQNFQRPGAVQGTSMMIAKLKVRGSSENRPKICLGGEVFLRPVEEDYHKLILFGLSPEPFEIRGICIHYQLSTEEAVFEFPGSVLPAHVPFDKVFNALRYHVRFDYERYGFLFIQWAVGNIMANRYLIESLFPNEDTVARLKQHCRQSKTPPCPPGLSQQLKVAHPRGSGTVFNASNGASSPHSLPIALENNGGGGLSASDQAASFNAQQLKAITAIGAFVADPRWATVHHPFLKESTQDFLPMPPFIIFGPPGTGKTSTVAEAILRICRTQPHKRILACAPSDAAADVICERLARHLSPAQLFRLNWWQRVSASMPAKLRPYTMDVNDIFEIPNASRMRSYQVIVCNCGTAGALKTLSAQTLGANNQLTFDLVVVDEASQAIESEILVPLELCKPSGLMVLSGDTNQLGPSTRCPLFPLCSDGASLQERLLRLPFYSACRPESVARAKQLDVDRLDLGASKESATAHVDRYGMYGMDESQDSSRNTSAINLEGLSTITNNWKREKQTPEEELPLGVFLYKNYRSHRAILEIPSRLFYGGALEECADRARTGLVKNWDKLARPNGEAFPLLMIGVDGQHQHEAESPSFYNTAEIEKVVEVCRDLVSSASLAPGTVTARDIGVIAAFRQQVLKLRLALRAAGLASVNVGSVEDFQGQEVKVVVISTVLSEWVDRYETKGAIGLIGDPKRFNVAVTRGMALCVVVGQPHLLYSDLHWRALLKYCIANGAYTGMDIDRFMRRNRSRGGSVDHPHLSGDENLPTDRGDVLLKTAAAASGTSGYVSDQEDDDLLNSVTEVANSMLQGVSPLDSILSSSAVLGAASQGHYVRGYDMEWRNIL